MAAGNGKKAPDNKEGKKGFVITKIAKKSAAKKKRAKKMPAKKVTKVKSMVTARSDKIKAKRK